MTRSFVVAAVFALAVAPAAAQPVGYAYLDGSDPIGMLLAQIDSTATPSNVRAAAALNVELGLEEPASAPQVGQTVRALTGAPVGEVAAVSEQGVVVKMQVAGKPALKQLAHADVEVKGDAVVSDLTLDELRALPNVQAQAEAAAVAE